MNAVTTIYDVAKAAGTSPATVSRVMNDRGGVKTDTARRIRQAMDALGFQPRWKAMDRDRVLVFVPEHKHALESGYVARILSGIADAAFAAGLGIQLRPFPSPRREVRDLRQLFLQEMACGCILISLYQGYSLPARLDLAGLPHVVVGHKQQDDDIHQILLDNFEAAVGATDYLLSLGHARISMVSFSHQDRDHLDRFKGYAQAMAQAGREPRPCVECFSATYEEGRSAARRLLGPRDRPTAVIVTNEELAVGFQAESKLLGFGIPQDLSLIAFEETEKLAHLDTALTAMRTPAYRLGAEALKMLQSMSARPHAGGPGKGLPATAPGDPLTRHLPITLLVRHSTAALADVSLV